MPVKALIYLEMQLIFNTQQACKRVEAVIGSKNLTRNNYGDWVKCQPKTYRNNNAIHRGEIIQLEMILILKGLEMQSTYDNASVLFDISVSSTVSTNWGSSSSLNLILLTHFLQQSVAYFLSMTKKRVVPNLPAELLDDLNSFEGMVLKFRTTFWIILLAWFP